MSVRVDVDQRTGEDQILLDHAIVGPWSNLPPCHNVGLWNHELLFPQLQLFVHSHSPPAVAWCACSGQVWPKRGHARGFRINPSVQGRCELSMPDSLKQIA